MKNDMSGRFYARVLANIFYSAAVTCLVEIFLVTNVSMVMDYLRESGRGGRFVGAMESGTIGVLCYVLLGIVVFSALFLILQKRSLDYIRKLLSVGNSLPPEMEKKYIDIAYTKAKRLEKLIEELFGFTKLNCGKISMKVGQVDIIKLLSQLLEEFYPSFMEKNLVYELRSNVPAKVITADGNLLARLFDNLINNAIKYGADGKRILVDVEADDEIVTVSVTNFGYVIPEKDLPLLFNKFYRVEHSRSAATGGTGLGLAIAKNIVDMHGGDIHVTSDLNGTVFTVKLKVNFDINKENFSKIG